MKGLGRAGSLVAVALAVWAGVASVGAAPLAQAEQRVSYGQTVEGFIRDEEGEERWVFSGAAGDVVLIDMTAVDEAQLDPLLTLLDSGGNTLATDDDGGVRLNARIGPYTLPTSGLYTIVAGRYNGVGAYRLSLHALNTAPTLRLNKALQGRLGEDVPVEYYQMQAEGDEPLLARLQFEPPDGSVETAAFRVTVYDAESQPIADFVTSAEESALLLLPQVRYIVAVSPSEEEQLGNGAYIITLTPSEASLLRDGEPQHGQLSALHPERRHYFIGQAGQVMFLSLAAPEGPLPSLYVQQQGEEERLLSVEGGAMNRLAVTFTLPADGAYVVGVRQDELAPSAGAYTLTVRWRGR